MYVPCFSGPMLTLALDYDSILTCIKYPCMVSSNPEPAIYAEGSVTSEFGVRDLKQTDFALDL